MGYEFLIGTFFVFCGFFVWLTILTAIMLKNKDKINILQDNVKNLYEISYKQANLIHEQNEILLNLATDFKNTIKRKIQEDKKNEVIYFDENDTQKNPKPHQSHTQNQSHTQKRDSRGRFAK